MTSTKSTVDTAIDALVAKGNTVIPAGLLWGWRVLSSTEPFTEGAAYSDEKWVKAIVLLTDGENDVSQASNGYRQVRPTTRSAIAKNGHLGNTNGSNAEATLDTKTLAVCTAIKNASRNRGRRGGHPALYDRLPGHEREQGSPEELREQARHVLQLADQRTACGHLPGYRARLERAAHRAIGVPGGGRILERG